MKFAPVELPVPSIVRVCVVQVSTPLFVATAVGSVKLSVIVTIAVAVQPLVVLVTNKVNVPAPLAVALIWLVGPVNGPPDQLYIIPAPVDEPAPTTVAPAVAAQTDAAATPATASLSDDAFKIKCPEAAAAVHMVPLTLTPPAEPGLFEEEFVLKIDGRAQPVTFKAKGRIAHNP